MTAAPHQTSFPSTRTPLPTRTEDAPHPSTKAAWGVGLVATLLLLGALIPPVGLPLNVLASPIAALLIVLALIGPQQGPRAALTVLVPLFVVLLLAALWGPPPMSEYGETKFTRLWTSTLLSALAGCLIYTRARVRGLALAWTVVALLLAVVTLAGGGTFNGGRATAFDSNPIWLARALGSATILCLALPRMGYSRAWSCVALFTLPAILLTGSRSPLIATLVGIAVLFLINSRRFLPVILAGVAAYVAFLNVPVLANSRAGRSLRGAGDDPEDDGGRTELWASAWDVWKEHPDGVGIGNWAPTANIRAFDWPHNLFLEVGAELGTLTAITLMVVTLVSLAIIHRQSSTMVEKRAILALLVFETIAVSTSGDLSTRTFFFLIAAVWALSAGLKHESTAAVDPTPPRHARAA